jgi:hypothetical protein
MFLAEEASLLLEQGLYAISIDLVEGEKPPFGPLYNLSGLEL